LLSFGATAAETKKSAASTRWKAQAKASSLATPNTTYYFHGTSSDDANRLAGTPTATFDGNAPTGSSDVTQTAGINGNANQPANTLSIYWLSTAYTGPINGTVSFDWYWSAASAATADTVTVTIYADANPSANTGTRIGKATATIQVGVMPVLNHTEIPNVYGFVNTNLLIQVTTTTADTAHYDSTVAPSSFTLPLVRPSGWSIVDSPNPPAGQANYLRGVACTSATDCWAVGFAQNYGTLVEHYDGNAWSIVPSPNVNNNGILFAVACTSASDCWAVGYAANTIFQTLIEHWDGNAWSVVSSPNPLGSQNNFLNGVTCVSANDCWAVGDYYIGLPGTVHQTLIEHYDGASWSIVNSPNTASNEQNVLYGVSCAAANDCWTVGSNDSRHKTLIEHYDGASWSIVPSPNASATNANYLYGVTCSTADNCWALGKYYAAGSTNSGAFYDTLVLHYDGTAWTLANSPSPGTWSNDVWGITCTSANDCWMAGFYGYPGSGAFPLMLHNDGTGWMPSTPQPAAHRNIPLYGIACANANDCWAVGNYNDGNCEGCIDKTLIEHYTAPPAVQLNAVVSRKIHGAAGSFDTALPLNGPVGIECRSGGANSDYTMVFTFANPLTSVGGASVSSGTGSISSSAIESNDAHNYIVNLTGVTNAQVITVGLTNVNDSAGNSSGVVSASMGVLVGDVTGERVVSNTDVAALKGQVAAPVTASNFRNDVNANGIISNTDVSATKAQVGASLP
jgi:hypothetical protein